MSYILVFTNESQQDLRDGFAWYEEKRIGLGFDFMLSIEATIKVIERNPFTYSQAPTTTIPNIRRAVVFKFSYLIFYTIVQQSVIILAVVSSKQDAAIWKTRIGEV